jgi:hypothetical protein
LKILISKATQTGGKTTVAIIMRSNQQHISESHLSSIIATTVRTPEDLRKLY